MRTIITSTGDQLTSEFDQRFGRASWFCLYDSETGNTTFIKNEFAEAEGGAGTKAAGKIAELKSGKVISGHFGPKAEKLLKELNIQMVALPDERNSIAQIINKLKTHKN